jgi:hypothetical protein
MLDPLVQRMKNYYATFPDFDKDLDTNGYFERDFLPIMASRERILQIAYIPVERQRIFEFNLAPLPAPATSVLIELAERQLGFKLPTLLRELFLEISDGGFGPHFTGISDYGWQDGFGDETTAVEFYLRNFRFFQTADGKTDPLWSKLLKQHLPIGFGGCLYVYLLDCRTENGPVLRWDAAGLAEDMGWDLMAHTLREWLEKWLDGGNCHEPIIENYRPV